jgi:hypothetical protein
MAGPAPAFESVAGVGIRPESLERQPFLALRAPLVRLTAQPFSTSSRAFNLRVLYLLRREMRMRGLEPPRGSQAFGGGSGAVAWSGFPTRDVPAPGRARRSPPQAGSRTFGHGLGTIRWSRLPSICGATVRPALPRSRVLSLRLDELPEADSTGAGFDGCDVDDASGVRSVRRLELYPNSLNRAGATQ